MIKHYQLSSGSARISRYVLHVHLVLFITTRSHLVVSASGGLFKSMTLPALHHFLHCMDVREHGRQEDGIEVRQILIPTCRSDLQDEGKEPQSKVYNSSPLQ